MNERRRNAGDTDAAFLITQHARQQLARRWPQTVLCPAQFDWIEVPRDAQLVGYDSSTSAQIVEVPDTPMAAVVAGGKVVTFLPLADARARIELHGYGPSDFANESEK